MKIYKREIPGTLMNEIFIIPEKNANSIQYMHLGKDGEVLVTQVENKLGGIPDVKPFMVMSEEQTRELIRAFTSLAKESGFEIESESHATGKLEAQSAHLQDLRTILKLK